MNKILKVVFLSFLGVSSFLILVWAVSNLFTANSQWARALAWLDSDYGDIDRFPNRQVANAAPEFEFKQPSAEVKAKFAQVFSTVTFQGKNGLVTQNFEEFMRDSDTVAFLVIQDDVLLYEGYFNGYNRESTVTSFSTAKSFVSALIWIAIAEGYIGSVDD